MRRGDETEKNRHSKIRFPFSIILEYRAWLNHRGEQKCETYGSAGTFGTAAFCPDVPFGKRPVPHSSKAPTWQQCRQRKARKQPNAFGQFLLRKH